MSSQTLIRFDKVSLGYGRNIILRNLSFGIERGEYFGLVGPNGAGKTTLLRSILGTLKPLEGRITVASIHDGPLRFGYVPQRDSIEHVLPYSVYEVVMMGRYRQIGALRRPGSQDREVVLESLRNVDIEDLRSRPYNALSGGQKQRALIARALASRPDVLVLDEPTNGMDLASKESILELIRRLHADGELTVMMVTHLLDDVANNVRRLALMDRDVFHEGETAQILSGPALRAVYGIDVTVAEVHGRKVLIPGGAHVNG